MLRQNEGEEGEPACGAGYRKDWKLSRRYGDCLRRARVHTSLWIHSVIDWKG